MNNKDFIIQLTTLIEWNKKVLEDIKNDQDNSIDEKNRNILQISEHIQSLEQELTFAVAEEQIRRKKDSWLCRIFKGEL